MEINKIYNECCLETMRRMEDGSIDLVVTSPPYDNLRTYQGYHFHFEDIAKSLYRVMKKGGVVVWVVGDQTINGSETGTSFRQALYFMELGFNLHDTMIWNKGSFTAVGTLKVRYAQTFEYMFVLSKGKVITFNPIMDRKNKVKGKIGGRLRLANGEMTQMSTHGNTRKEYGQRFAVWDISPCGGNKSNHPAPYPEQLALDHIKSWSNEYDIVYDPFTGSGTTAKMAIRLNRKYVGSEISSEYCQLAEKRIANEKKQGRFNLAV